MTTSSLYEPVPLGRSVTNGAVRVHRWACYVEVTDLTNAGRRGKQVRSFLFEDRRDSQCGRSDWGRRMAAALVDYDSFDRARAFAADVAADFPSDVRITDRTLRGVDVEPEGRFDLGAAEGVHLSIGPHDFTVRNRNHFARPDGSGFAQDTHYSPASKRDAARFYAWAVANRHALHGATMAGLRSLWSELGVRYDSH